MVLTGASFKRIFFNKHLEHKPLLHFLIITYSFYHLKRWAVLAGCHINTNLRVRKYPLWKSQKFLKSVMEKMMMMMEKRVFQTTAIYREGKYLTEFFCEGKYLTDLFETLILQTVYWSVKLNIILRHSLNHPGIPLLLAL